MGSVAFYQYHAIAFPCVLRRQYPSLRLRLERRTLPFCRIIGIQVYINAWILRYCAQIMDSEYRNTCDIVICFTLKSNTT